MIAQAIDNIGRRSGETLRSTSEARGLAHGGARWKMELPSRLRSQAGWALQATGLSAAAPLVCDSEAWGGEGFITKCTLLTTKTLGLCGCPGGMAPENNPPLKPLPEHHPGLVSAGQGSHPFSDVPQSRASHTSETLLVSQLDAPRPHWTSQLFWGRNPRVRQPPGFPNPVSQYPT
ncbi:hypothetical protein G7Z17_g11071 [Cylindrodendrum hubeiense]|uniref:Uncharacterized protein n=1 Tax=Cylindrodendrum hubeiense TaxID=595255 RepID=A0A9P5H5W2_9HYPO|nr:hypothetical protein G7Z17_g11071 [Cylindrodendrum hubeiense]